MSRERKILTLVILLMQTMIGTACESEDQRLARLATEYADRQAEQGSQVIDLQQELMTGSRQLIEANSRARTEMIDLHREIQEERRSLDLVMKNWRQRGDQLRGTVSGHLISSTCRGSFSCWSHACFR